MPRAVLLTVIVTVLCLTAALSCARNSNSEAPEDDAFRMAAEEPEYILFTNLVRIKSLNEKINALHEIGYEVVATAVDDRRPATIIITMRRMSRTREPERQSSTGRDTP